MRIVHLHYFNCYYFGRVRILVDRLFVISKYGSSSERAVGPIFKLGPIWIYVRLEYSRRSSIDDEIVIFTLFDISNVASWFHGWFWVNQAAGQVRLLVVEGRKEGVWWQTNV